MAAEAVAEPEAVAATVPAYTELASVYGLQGADSPNLGCESASLHLALSAHKTQRPTHHQLCPRACCRRGGPCVLD